jgi:NAD-dependent deacetylase
MSKDLILQFADFLRESSRVLFITGAGVSADSGLPTYRGVGGLYNDKLTDEGYSIEQCLSASMFARRPEITWKYMIPIAESVFQCEPNAAHKIIAKLESEFANRGGKVFVLTQNIDGYHKQAGSINVFEIHGTLRKLFCTNNQCDWKENYELEPLNNLSGDKTNEIINAKLISRFEQIKKQLPPRCPICNSLIRPDIVLFEESLPYETLLEFDKEFANGDGFDLVVSVGTSAMFPYIVAPIGEAKRKAKKTVNINPALSDLSKIVDLNIQSTAAETFGELKL